MERGEVFVSDRGYGAAACRSPWGMLAVVQGEEASVDGLVVA